MPFGYLLDTYQIWVMKSDYFHVFQACTGSQYLGKLRFDLATSWRHYWKEKKSKNSDDDFFS